MSTTTAASQEFTIAAVTYPTGLTGYSVHLPLTQGGMEIGFGKTLAEAEAARDAYVAKMGGRKDSRPSCHYCGLPTRSGSCVECGTEI